MNNKALVWLILGVASVVGSMLFTFISVFPLGDSIFSMLVITMFALFAVAFVLLFSKFRKVKNNIMYTLITLAGVFVPIVFGFWRIFPLLDGNIAVLYFLMHFIFAGGIVALYSQRTQIMKLF